MNTAHLLRATAAALAFVIVVQTSVRVSCAGPPLEPQSSCANVTRDFVRSGAPRNDRYLDFFRACGNLESLELLIGGLAKTNGPRDPLELFAAVDATLNSPALKNDTEATALIARTVRLFPTRATAHFLRRRSDAAVQMPRSSRYCNTTRASAYARRRPKHSRNLRLRSMMRSFSRLRATTKMPAFVQKHGLPWITSSGCITGPIGLSLSMRSAMASR
jgi:hypothetical protein